MTVSVVAGVLLAPVGLLVSLGIRCSAGRPVFFVQERSGLRGAVFVIWKFRTMRPATHPGETDDERLFTLGRFLRASSLDELPQLWNILRGDMSFIGPRPTLPEQVDCYSARQRGRLAVRPGLTGWAQVNGRNSLSWPERIELDLWYIEHRSLRLDLQIAWLTVLNLVRPRGIVGLGGINPGFPAAEPATDADRSESTPSPSAESSYSSGMQAGRRAPVAPDKFSRQSVTEYGEVSG